MSRPHQSTIHERPQLLDGWLMRAFVLVTAPLIYALIVPLVLLDVAATVFQLVCFPLYKIARVRRSDHLIFDRGRLPYLSVLEKVNCAYCSYANGLISYVREIAGRTEQYWCAIKHARNVPAPHERYRGFARYGDARAFERARDRLRGEMRDEYDEAGAGRLLFPDR
jgi:hypothetical protein